jgi:hypothetical protein
MSADIQRWSKRRKAEIVMRLLRGESLDDVSRDVGVEISRLWPVPDFRPTENVRIGLKKMS